MHKSIMQVWDYLTQCGHTTLWLKQNPLPLGYNGSKYKCKPAIYSAAGRILATLDVHKEHWVYTGFTPRCLPADKNRVMIDDGIPIDRGIALHITSLGY